MCRSPRVRSAVSEVLDGTVHLKTGPASVTSSSAQSPDSSPPLERPAAAPSFSPAQLTPLRVASNKSWHGGTAAWDALNGRSASTSPGGFRRLSLSRRKPSRSLSVPDQLDQLVAAHNSSPISPRLLFRSRAAASVLAPAAASAVADVTAAPVSPPPPRRPPTCRASGSAAVDPVHLGDPVHRPSRRQRAECLVDLLRQLAGR